MDPTALGRYLRESREAKELTLEDAVRTLRIRREIFESFEQGDFDVADSSVRIRGMLRNYARFLGLEEERVLQYYEAAENEKSRIRRRFGRRKPRTEPIAPRNITDTPPALPAVTVSSRPRFNFGAALRNIAFFLISLAAIVVIVFVIYDTLDFNNLTEPVAIVPTLVLGATSPTLTNTPSITPSTLEVISTPDNFARGITGVQVILEMTQRSWLRIVVDDAEVFTGVLAPDESMQFEGSESVQITANNAAALQITYNDIEQELFGRRGQQVDLLFGINAVEISLGEGAALPTASETQQINLVSPTPFAPDVTQENNVSVLPATETQLEVSPTALISDIESPTPFLVDNTLATETTETEAAQESASLETTESPQEIATATAIPTATENPSETASPMVVLPLRATSDNATATKTQ
jgi:cytoskeletal protein RodZ